MKINNRQQLLALIAVAGLLLLVADRFVFTPLTHAWERRSDRIAQLNQSIRQGELLIEREQTIRNRWTSMRTNTFPVDESVAQAQLIGSLNRWAIDSGIGVAGIQPQRRSAQDYKASECQVQALGSMDRLTRFLYDLEKDPLAVRIVSADFTPRDKNGRQIALDLRLSGLILTPKTE